MRELEKQWPDFSWQTITFLYTKCHAKGEDFLREVAEVLLLERRRAALDASRAAYVQFIEKFLKRDGQL
jgi:hypothetical protein